MLLLLARPVEAGKRARALESPPVAPLNHRAQRRLRAATRAAQAAAPAATTGPSSGLSLLSYLERRSVLEPTLQDYRHRLDCLDHWFLLNHVVLNNLEDLDAAIILYLDKLYFEGRTLARAPNS